MSKSISRDEKKRMVEEAEAQGSRGAGEKGGEEAGGTPALQSPVAVTKWAGLDNYECGLCAYATLDAEAMVGHLRAVHNWVEVPLPGGEGTRSEEASAAVAGEEENNQDEVK